MIAKDSVEFFFVLVLLLRIGSCESIQQSSPAMDENESIESSLRNMMTESLRKHPIYQASIQLKVEYKQQIILKFREQKPLFADRLYRSLAFNVMPSRNVSVLLAKLNVNKKILEDVQKEELCVRHDSLDADHSVLWMDKQKQFVTNVYSNILLNAFREVFIGANIRFNSGIRASAFASPVVESESCRSCKTCEVPIHFPTILIDLDQYLPNSMPPGVCAHHSHFLDPRGCSFESMVYQLASDEPPQISLTL